MCEKWLYESDGAVTKRRDGKGGWVPIPRPKRAGGLPGKTPCETCPKIPRDSIKDRHHAIEMTAESRQVLEHYLRCRAVGKFPDDPLVMRDAAVIRSVFDACERDDRARFERLLIDAVTLRTGV